MRVRSRSIYLKDGKKVQGYYPTTDRRFLARIHAYSAERMRVIVRYRDDGSQYSTKALVNDSGWYRSKAKLLKTAKAFLDEGR